MKEYFEKFVEDVVDLFNMNLEDKMRFIEICKSYGVDWKLGKINMTKNENTGTKYCKGCKYYYYDNSGSYCVLPKFDGEYTKECPMYEKNI